MNIKADTFNIQGNDLFDVVNGKSKRSKKVTAENVRNYMVGTLSSVYYTKAETDSLLNAKQDSLLGSGLVKSTGGVITYITDNSSEWDLAYAEKINSASFNTSTGDVTLTQQGGGTITLNLDGRYLTSETDNQTLSWNGSTGEITISNGNTIDIDGRYSLVGHTHTSGDITDFSTASIAVINSHVDKTFVDALGINAVELNGENGAYYLDWNNFTSVPSTFTPSPHTHTTSDITNLGSYTGFDSRYYTETEIDLLLDDKQDNLNGTGLVKSTAGVITYITDSSTEWNAAYNEKINSAAFNTSTGDVTLTQQSGGTIIVNLDGRYLTSETDSQTLSWNSTTGEISISNGNTIDIDGRYSLLAHTHTTSDITNLSSYTGFDARYFTETEINNFFSGATAKSGYNKTNWDTAFGWGNHASAGYALDSNVVHKTGAETVAGNKTFTSIISADGAIEVPYLGGSKKPMIILKAANTYGLFHTEGADDSFSFDYSGIEKHKFVQNGDYILQGYMHMNTGKGITFYGNSNLQHSITSTNVNGASADDLRVNSYGAFYINLDSNSNNVGAASFQIGRHGSTTTISDWLFTVDGEGAGTTINSGDLTVSNGSVIATGGNSTNWNTAYSRSITSIGSVIVSPGNITLYRESGGSISNTLRSIGVGDARNLNHFTNSNTQSNFTPNPNDTQLDKGLTPIFSKDANLGSSRWGGGFIMKGWGGGSYRAWQMMGTADSVTTNQNKWSLRSGADSTWGDWYQIWTEFDFDSNDISNWDAAYAYSLVGHNPTIGIDGNNSLTGATVVSTINMTGGVVTAFSTRTLTLANLGYTGATNADNYVRWNFEVNGTNTTPITSNATLNLIAGSNINITKNNNDITINATDTNTTYSAGSGLDLSGTTFSVEPDLRDGITHIGLDTTDYISFTNNSQMNFYVNNGNAGRFTSGGDLLVKGDVVASAVSLSDRRLKTNIKTIENATDKVSKLRGVSYKWKDGAKKGMSDIGVIAQEVEEVLPEIVHDKEMLDGTTMKTVDYEKMIALLIESNKELMERVKRLEDGSTNK